MSPVVTRAAAPPEQRRDIQGLRAVAVALVVGFHLWPGAVPAGFVGVDVFFVVSGYLITRMLLARPPRTGRDLARFWERRIRRLLPAALLVLLVTLMATRLLAPETQWVRTAKEGVAAALYGENWMLVASAADYLAPGTPPTPVQHFWSLGVEEQFYVLWPVLILAAGWLVRGRRRTAVHTARATIAAVLAASFAYGLAVTAVDATSAYFQTPTRVWELAAGGIVATWSPARRAPRTRALAAWVGLAVAVSSAWVFTAGTPWPGWSASVPVLGAALFLRANAHGRWSPVGLLGARPVQWLGDASYSVYLWHWPVLVLAPYALDRPLGWPERVGVLAVSLGLAYATTRFVENRWRRPRHGSALRVPFRAAVVGMAAVCLVAAVQVYGFETTERRLEATQVLEASGPCFGAAALASGTAVCPAEPDADVVPAPARSVTDLARPFQDGCMVSAPYREPRSCTYGSGRLRVALVGNSHAAQWLPALQELQDDGDFSVTTYLVTACTTVDAPTVWADPRSAEGCADWRDATLDATKGRAYDLVITSQRSVQPVVGHTGATTYRPWVDGFRSYLRKWVDSGTKVLVIRDSPLPGATLPNVPDCVAENPFDQDECSGLRASWLRPDPLVDAAEEVGGIPVVDLTSYLCGAVRCDGVNGGVITYLDGSHVTRTYARSVAPYLRPAVEEALGG